RRRSMSTVPRRARSMTPPRTQIPEVTFLTDRFTLTVPPEAHAIPGFREWATQDDFPERVRVTFVPGEIILDMSHEEGNTHVAVKTEFVGALGTVVKQLRLGKFYSDGALVSNEEAAVSNNPDALFLSRATPESKPARLVPRKGAEPLYREIAGTPA